MLMKSTVLILSALAVALAAGVLFERLRKVSPVRLTVGLLATIASTVVIWDALPAHAKHDIGRRADAVRLAATQMTAEAVDEIFLSRSKHSCPPGQGSLQSKCVASIDNAAHKPTARPAPCKTNEYFSRFEKKCVPEWNVRTSTHGR